MAHVIILEAFTYDIQHAISLIHLRAYPSNTRLWSATYTECVPDYEATHPYVHHSAPNNSATCIHGHHNATITTGEIRVDNEVRVVP